MTSEEYGFGEYDRKSGLTANKGDNSPKKFKVIVGICIAVLVLLIILLLRGCNSSAKMELSMECDEFGDLTFKIEGVSKSKMKNYRVAVINGNDLVDTMLINSKGLAKYSVINMLDGECYTFKIVDAKTLSFVPSTKDTTYCKPGYEDEDTDECLAPGAVSCDYEPNRKNKPYSYTVTIHVDNISKLSNVVYLLDRREQRDSIFRGVAPGNYEVVVRVGNKYSSCQVILDNINDNCNPITLSEVQKIFNQVSGGKLSAGAAYDQIATGYVMLASPVDGKSSLQDLLHEMEFGAKIDDPVYYTVVSFSTNPNTCHIQSGTLKVKAK